MISNCLHVPQVEYVTDEFGRVIQDVLFVRQKSLEDDLKKLFPNSITPEKKNRFVHYTAKDKKCEIAPKLYEELRAALYTVYLSPQRVVQSKTTGLNKKSTNNFRSKGLL